MNVFFTPDTGFFLPTGPLVTTTLTPVPKRPLARGTPSVPTPKSLTVSRLRWLSCSPCSLFLFWLQFSLLLLASSGGGGPWPRTSRCCRLARHLTPLLLSTLPLNRLTLLSMFKQLISLHFCLIVFFFFFFFTEQTDTIVNV